MSSICIFSHLYTLQVDLWGYIYKHEVWRSGGIRYKWIQAAWFLNYYRVQHFCRLSQRRFSILLVVQKALYTRTKQPCNGSIEVDCLWLIQVLIPLTCLCHLKGKSSRLNYPAKTCLGLWMGQAASCLRALSHTHATTHKHAEGACLCLPLWKGIWIWGCTPGAYSGGTSRLPGWAPRCLKRALITHSEGSQASARFVLEMPLQIVLNDLFMLSWADWPALHLDMQKGRGRGHHSCWRLMGLAQELRQLFLSCTCMHRYMHVHPCTIYPCMLCNVWLCPLWLIIPQILIAYSC